jgi:hypothetical protein
VTVLSPVVLAHAAWTVAIRNSKPFQRNSIRGELVGGEGFGVDALVLQKASHQFHRSGGVTPLLNEHVQYFTLVVDRAPQKHPPATDLHNHLVQMPPARRSHPPTPDVGGDQRTELDHPAPDRLPADLDSTLSQQFLDVADAQSETKIAKPPVLGFRIETRTRALAWLLRPHGDRMWNHRAGIRVQRP